MEATKAKFLNKSAQWQRFAAQSCKPQGHSFAAQSCKPQGQRFAAQSYKPQRQSFAEQICKPQGSKFSNKTVACHVWTRTKFVACNFALQSSAPVACNFVLQSVAPVGFFSLCSVAFFIFSIDS
jgi:hypothetical protein